MATGGRAQAPRWPTALKLMVNSFVSKVTSSTVFPHVVAVEFFLLDLFLSHDDGLPRGKCTFGECKWPISNPSLSCTLPRERTLVSALLGRSFHFVESDVDPAIINDEHLRDTVESLAIINRA